MAVVVAPGTASRLTVFTCIPGREQRLWPSVESNKRTSNTFLAKTRIGIFSVFHSKFDLIHTLFYFSKCLFNGVQAHARNSSSRGSSTCARKKRKSANKLRRRETGFPLKHVQHMKKKKHRTKFGHNIT